MQARNICGVIAMAMLAGAASDLSAAASEARGSYADLTTLFAKWRSFERPPQQGGAPDYTQATFARRHDELKTYQARLAAIDPGSGKDSAEPQKSWPQAVHRHTRCGPNSDGAIEPLATTACAVRP